MVPVAFEALVERVSALLRAQGLRAHLAFLVAGVALADGLFYGYPVGWTLGAYGGVVGVAAAWLGGSRDGRRPATLLAACFLCLCLRAMVDPDSLVVFLGLIVWIVFTLTVRVGWTWDFALWFNRGLRFLGSLLKSYLIAGAVLVLSPLAPLLVLLKVRRLRDWLVPLLLGLVFLALFAFANPVLSRVLQAAAEGLEQLWEHLPDLVSVPRMLFWLTVGAWLWTLLRHAPLADEVTVAVQRPPPLPGSRPLLAPEVIRNALIIFNVLFAIQTVSDVWYLWGGAALPEGMTYAEYAHRGAYPLVVTALLAAAFVLATFHEGAPAAEHRGTRRLVYAWLIQNVFLVLSAGWRLWLYVGVYSLSRLRLAAVVWMFLVACGLVWIFARIFARRSNEWLVKVNLVTAFVALMAYGLWTPNLFIASFNVGHCLETGHPAAQPIDLTYLSGLGYDALPALVRLEREVQGQPLACKVRPIIDRLSVSLDARMRDWRGVTLKRWVLRAYMDRTLRSHTCVGKEEDSRPSQEGQASDRVH